MTDRSVTSNEKTMSHQNSGPDNYVHKQFHAQIVEQKDAEIMRLRAALHRINKWFGEFPPTGKTWADGSAMSYGAAYGSNGERDYMRQIAHEALSGDSYPAVETTARIAEHEDIMPWGWRPRSICRAAPFRYADPPTPGRPSPVSESVP